VCFYGAPESRKVLALNAAYIDLFHKREDGLQTVVLGRALDAADNQDLMALPTRLEIWSLPRSPALGFTIGLQLQVTDWDWSPLDLDAQREGLAMEWATAGLLELCVERVAWHEAPPYVQELR
jgi:hypothetical protein